MRNSLLLICMLSAVLDLFTFTPAGGYDYLAAMTFIVVAYTLFESFDGGGDPGIYLLLLAGILGFLNIFYNWIIGGIDGLALTELILIVGANFFIAPVAVKRVRTRRRW
jgi:hypothetical protein